MPTRRQENVAHVVKKGVSKAIANHLSDPRIEGFVSVTDIQMSPDLRNADVYISIFGGDEAVQNKTFAAIVHARRRIQSIVARDIQSKFSPVLHFHKDDVFKKTLDTMKVIEKVAKELEKKDSSESGEQ